MSEQLDRIEAKLDKVESMLEEIGVRQSVSLIITTILLFSLPFFVRTVLEP